MLYSICIGLILVASVILILAILVQNPKSGMAANFGAANQVMGVRESTNILEKTTWTLAGLVVVLSLIATISMKEGVVAGSSMQSDAEALIEKVSAEAATDAMPQAEISSENAEEATSEN
ncbi:MAG: preprotein translocase subunit SecG [Alistipes sp.]|nr:preprotein translocase subunit SecG [Alistipes sp.]